MPKSKNRGHRETRKAQQELPELPPQSQFGRLSAPKKTNRKAAKYVAEVGFLWDRRRADRRALRNALERQVDPATDPRRQHLDKLTRSEILERAAGWSFDQRERAFVARDHELERLEELTAAATATSDQPMTLPVAGVTQNQARQMTRRLPEGSLVVAVRPPWTAQFV